MEEGVGYAVGGVADYVAFVGEVAGDAVDAHGLDFVDVGLDDFGAFRGVACLCGGGDGRGVDDGVVEDGLAGMVVDALDVLGCGEVQAFIGLGHEVGDVDAGAGGGGDGLGDSWNEQVGDEAGEERAGTESDEVGLGDGVEGFRQGLDADGFEHELVDDFPAGGDAGFSADDGAVGHAGGEGDVVGGDGVDVPGGGEDFGGEADGLGEVAGHFDECCDEQVAEVVAFELASGAEAVLEEAGDEPLVLGERDHAVAEVAGGKHFEVLAEATAGAAVVGDGDNSGEVADPCVGGVFGVEEGACAGVGDDMVLESAEKRGKAGAAADGDDAAGC